MQKWKKIIISALQLKIKIGTIFFEPKLKKNQKHSEKVQIKTS